jgi:hypothetical protein
MSNRSPLWAKSRSTGPLLKSSAAARWEPLLASTTVPLDRKMIERAAKSLFEAVFSRCARLDGKKNWANCDEEIKDGFRREAAAVIRAAWPFITLVQPSDLRRQ